MTARGHSHEISGDLGTFLQHIKCTHQAPCFTLPGTLPSQHSQPYLLWKRLLLIVHHEPTSTNSTSVPGSSCPIALQGCRESCRSMDVHWKPSAWLSGCSQMPRRSHGDAFLEKVRSSGQHEYEIQEAECPWRHCC